MKPEFTADGVDIQTFDEIFTELADGYRSIYGADINLDPDSPDGQRVAIEARHVLDAQLFGAALVNQLDPDFAIGQALNTVIKYAGITRQPPARSQVDVTVTTDRPVTLPDDYTVEDDLGQKWITLSSVALTSGATTVTLFAENFGSVEADPGTVTTPVTIVLGVTDVTNPSSATVGRDEETDAELRARRNRSIQNPSTSSIGGMFSVIGNLTNVTDLAIYENDTDATDSRGIPAHHIWLIVEGGSVSDIAEAMAKNKTGGTGTLGGVTGTYNETVTRPDGTDFTIIHEMNFDRPTLTPIEVRLTATRKDASDPVDTAQIQAELADREFVIFENAIASALYSTVYEAGDNFIATELEISLDGMTWTDGQLDADPDSKFTIDAADVSVTEVTP